jgi:small subunit ribosomal protein S20
VWRVKKPLKNMRATEFTTSAPLAAGRLTSIHEKGIVPPPQNQLKLPEVRQVANTPQARKRARQAEKNRKHNASFRSMVRTYIKKVDAAIESGDADQAKAAYQAAVPVIDRMADKGIMHKNKASRHKSRLNQKIKALG